VVAEKVGIEMHNIKIKFEDDMVLFLFYIMLNILFLIAKVIIIQKLYFVLTGCGIKKK
jgi:hypothetical protein